MPCEVKVLLVGHSFRSDNLGVGALSIGSTALLHEAAQTVGVDLQVDTYGTSGDSDYRDESAVPVHRELSLSRRELVHGLLRGELWSEYDLVIDISEGDSFANLYGSGRLIDQMLMKVTGSVSRAKYILAPQTLGPFGPVSGLVARAVVRFSEAAFGRDPRSCAAFPGAIQATDVAFAAEVPKSASAANQGCIGLNVSGLLYNGVFGDETAVRQYHCLIDDVIRALKTSRFEVRLVPHVLAETGDGDLGVCRELGERHGLRVLDVRSPLDAKYQVSSLAGFIGSRMHAVIAAVSTGVPAVAVSYSVKFGPLLNSLGYPAVEELSSGVTAKAIMGWLENLPELGRAAEGASDEARRRLEPYQRYLIQVLGEFL